MLLLKRKFYLSIFNEFIKQRNKPVFDVEEDMHMIKVHLNGVQQWRHFLNLNLFQLLVYFLMNIFVDPSLPYLNVLK